MEEVAARYYRIHQQALADEKKLNGIHHIWKRWEALTWEERNAYRAMTDAIKRELECTAKKEGNEAAELKVGDVVECPKIVQSIDLCTHAVKQEIIITFTDGTIMQVHRAQLAKRNLNITRWVTI
jgi:hypothetical protein